MKQLVVEKNNPDPILLDTPIPKPGPGEVLSKNHYSVVSSGTELAAIEFANTGVSEKLQNSSNIEKGLKLLKDDGIRAVWNAVFPKNILPLQLGYSSSGEVVQTGKGVEAHGTKSGVTHQVCETEEQAFEEIRYLMCFLPQSSSQKPPMFITEDEPSRVIESLDGFIPENRNQPYDMEKIILDIVDDGEHYPIQSNYATNIITSFARINGNTTGIVANQPMELAGVLDIKASEKAARFVRFCDAFNIPILTLVDVPGFLPGVEQEHSGIIRSGAKLLYAYSEATVPRVCVVIRKAYGGAYIVMDSIGLGADKLFAWPSGEIAVMGAEGAVFI